MEIAPPTAGASESPAVPWRAPTQPEEGRGSRLGALYERYERGLLATVAIAFTVVVFHPIVRNFFYMDDFLNIYHIVNKTFVDYILRPHGGHLLVTRNSLFYLFHAAFGTHAEYYYLAALLTHLLNVYVLFEVIRLFTSSARLACLGATLWGTAPMNEGSLGWYSVYGHVVVGTFLLIILYQIARSNAAERPLPGYTVWLWLFLLLLASTSFGVGIGITLVFPFVVWLLLPPSRQRTRMCLVFLAFAILFPLFYRWLVTLHVTVTGAENEAQGVSLLFAGLRYWDLIVAMLGYLLSYGVATLILGLSTLRLKFDAGIPYIVSGIYVLAMVVIGIASPARTRRRILAMLFIATGCYAMIAAGRATFFTLSNMVLAVVQPRYHYVAPIPLAIILTLLLERIGVWVPVPAVVKTTLLVLWLIAVGVVFHRSDLFIDHHTSARREATTFRETLQAMIDAAPAGEPVYVENQSFRSVGPMLVGYMPGFPGWAAMFAMYFPEDVVNGRRVYFVTKDREVLKETAHGLRTGSLLVGPDAAPAQ